MLSQLQKPLIADIALSSDTQRWWALRTWYIFCFRSRGTLWGRFDNVIFFHLYTEQCGWLLAYTSWGFGSLFYTLFSIRVRSWKRRQRPSSYALTLSLWQKSLPGTLHNDGASVSCHRTLEVKKRCRFVSQSWPEPHRCRQLQAFSKAAWRFWWHFLSYCFSFRLNSVPGPS